MCLIRLCSSAWPHYRDLETALQVQSLIKQAKSFDTGERPLGFILAEDLSWSEDKMGRWMSPGNSQHFRLYHLVTSKIFFVHSFQRKSHLEGRDLRLTGFHGNDCKIVILLGKNQKERKNIAFILPKTVMETHLLILDKAQEKFTPG